MPDIQAARMMNRGIRKVLPRSLLGRSLLIILLPLVLLEAVALQIFYGSHLDVVSRRLSWAVAGEIAYTLELMNRLPGEQNASWIVRQSWEQFHIKMVLEPGATLPVRQSTNIFGPMDDDLASALEEKIRRPYLMDWTSDPQSVLIRIQLADG